MQHKPSRRKFITTAATAGLAASLSPFALAAKEKEAYKINTDKVLVFLFQGDSITDGNRGRNTDPNHIMGHGYAFSIASRVGADFPADGYTFYNRGVSGNRIPDLKARWQTDTLDIKPDVLSVLVGINDTGAAVRNTAGAATVDEFETGYRALLNEVKTVKPDTLFVLGLPFVFAVGKIKDDWDKWRDGTAQRAERVKAIAKEFNAVVVDYPAVFDKAIKRAPIEYWIWDGVHPTVPAHELMAREWIKQTSSRLKFLKKYV